MGPGVLLKIAAVAGGDLVFVGVCVEMLSVSSLELKPLSFEIPRLGVEVILGCSFTLVLCCTPG